MATSSTQGLSWSTSPLLTAEVEQIEVALRSTTTAPATPVGCGWTILDRAPGNAVALVGLADGRTMVVISAAGSLREDDFIKPEVVDKEHTGLRPFAYRHTFDGARKVWIQFDTARKAWLTGGAENIDPKAIGRVHAAENQEAFEANLRNMADELAAKPEAERAAKIGDMLVALARHSYNRGWKESGLGWF